MHIPDIATCLSDAMREPGQSQSDERKYTIYLRATSAKDIQSSDDEPEGASQQRCEWQTSAM
jgi:hypothetical protein